MPLYGCCFVLLHVEEFKKKWVNKWPFHIPLLRHVFQICKYVIHQQCCSKRALLLSYNIYSTSSQSLVHFQFSSAALICFPPHTTHNVYSSLHRKKNIVYFYKLVDWMKWIERDVISLKKSLPSCIPILSSSL